MSGTDSPHHRVPLDPKEQPILDRILIIRDHLSLLKQDRTTYVKSADVTKYYTQLIEQVELLNRIRSDKRNEQNRVDTVLDDCFRLISLFFLTIGRNREAPAIYSAVSTVKRLLDHLKEAGFYLPADLKSISEHVEKWEQTIERGREEHSHHILTLLEARIGVCRTTLRELQAPLANLEGRMMRLYEKLVSILRSLSACNCRSKYPEKEVEDFRQQLLAIQDEVHFENDPHEGKTAEEVYVERLAMIQICETCQQPPEVVVKSLLARCLLWVEIIEQKRGKIDPRFQDQFDRLLKIRNTLENASLTQAWSLRETDLYDFQRTLDRVDEARVDGQFLDAEGKPSDLHAQRTLLYLLRKGYAMIYQYIISSEPVSEALLPIYNQLLTLKKCLVEVKKAGGVDSPRELYPYSMKLNSIDNMKKDGKFMIGDDIPEGQASVQALLAECFDLAYDLRNDAQEKDEPEPEAVNSVGVGIENKA
ncbi:CUB1 family protein [Fulvia fulva]|uniref:CUB1 family protein n=1 Tax=Passalora fulva TaxID=5499 RepID=A0A9Q8PLS4_PASFU|nr:CUB1 family protein [Fulvia fulva]KAK4610503.1 CUB1 family protein [Fulvia fulva]KAK4611028.1 CUB1 family protein [Fulvia fulva]UJO24813.1 CUB1 family protein [Fulvia fulva]WPV22291.1 CUB1 family protein [Fulvia fulva]WPV36806.1 CUB1 family protein [Fulvia fulva]